MNPSPHIEVRRLTKRYPSGGSSITVLNEVDLSINRGDSVAIVGPSGSGKSTLLALIAGLERPTSGEVYLDGRRITDLSEDELAILRRRSIGFVFQSFQLLSNLTARENVLLPLELAGCTHRESRVDALLSEVGLQERGHHYPSQLSGGEQQRVAVARAFATSPPILLADEPTGNLDSATGSLILEMMRHLRVEIGSTLVLVTHDPEVAKITDRVVRLQDGRVTSDAAGGTQV
ncbi:MAG: ABC transporter ATP-binding protein [Thermoanaerobaculia bacterium]